MADTSFTARVGGLSKSRTGSKVKFAFDMSKAHFFDNDTERTILD